MQPEQKIVNGILQIGEKPVFAVGQSYFPSFHPLKMPCPPEKDQAAEMERDLEEIRNAASRCVRRMRQRAEKCKFRSFAKHRQTSRKLWQSRPFPAGYAVWRRDSV